MSRRQSVTHHACELCRQRKRKCNGDGENPCKSCHEAGAECVYAAATRVSKAFLREELARLQTVNSENSAILDAISSPNTAPDDLKDILLRLSEGQPRSQVAALVSQRDSISNSSIAASPVVSTSALLSASPVSPAFGASIKDSSKSPLNLLKDPAAGVSTPDGQFQANLAQYRTQLPKLLDAILARDCLTFCPIPKEDLLKDFKTGYGQYCSTALIDSLLALATLLAKDEITLIAASMPTNMSDVDLGDLFAQEAIAALYNGTGLPHRIADIQTLGILSLYCLGRGKMQDGRGFAADYTRAVNETWHSEQPSKANFESISDKQAYANLYCAAISLNRVLFLVHDYNITLKKAAESLITPVLAPKENDINISWTQLNLLASIIDDAFFTKDLSTMPNNPRVIAAKLFEFTEWVYKARQEESAASYDAAVKVYLDGLRWYDSFFAYTNTCTSDTPLILFAHTYYQFCVLCLLTPYLLEKAPVVADGTLPLMVCKQAAISIDQFVKHYCTMYSDGRLLDFMPMFLLAGQSFQKLCAELVPTL